MTWGNSLTISACSRLAAKRGPVLLAAALLAGCSIEVGPPPESDPPLVPETAKAPPPPPQPSEPQPWSRGLDLQSVPVAADRGQMAEGLVADDVQARYSGERLTFESAFDPEKPPSQAELIRRQAQQRAASAGLPPPPQVAAAPVTEVESQALPPEGEAAPESRSSADDAWARRQSRLPAPPTFPAPSTTEPAAPSEAAAAPEAPDPAHGDQVASAAAFAAEAWDAPAGTILVQVAAVPDGGQVAQEWQRLQSLYPQVLEPLRLVVDEARLGERGVFYRVQAGGFGSQARAAAACDSLISRGQACFVVVR